MDVPYENPAATIPGKAELGSITAQLLLPERLLLYALVFGRRPLRVLEIGSAEGGSAQIICRALDDLGYGRLVCVDPQFRFEPGVGERIAHRVTLINGRSPAALPEAAQAVDGPFEFVFIDGDHTEPGCRRDIEGVLPFVAPDTLIVLHDTHYPPVRQAIAGAVASGGGRLIDCGVLSRLACMVELPGKPPESWSGLHLLRVGAS